MSLIDIIVISVGLAMDACAVSISKGLTLKKHILKNALLMAFFFGLFQGLMPIIGFYFGKVFGDIFASIDHWIAFILLAAIGINMIKESFSKEEKQEENISIKSLLLLAIATSIDALVVGITFSLLNSNIFLDSSIIAVITFVISFIGVYLGRFIGGKLQNKAEIAGGIILILIGLKILLEHLQII